MSARAHRRVLAAGAITLLATLACSAGAAPGAAASPRPAMGTTSTTAQPAPYPGDPTREAALVTAEEQRIGTLRNLSADAQRLNPTPGTTSHRRIPDATVKAYLVPGSGMPTLVLPPRTAPYGLDDLRAAAPQQLTEQPDGSLVLSAHVLVTQGADLELVAPGTTLRLASGAPGASSGSFATIVSLGGRLDLSGAQDRLLTITSWNGFGPDTTTSDGRPYIRAEGGQFALTHASVSDLGFWSAHTGGVAVAGATRAVVTTPGGARSGTSCVIQDVSVTDDAYGLYIADVSGLRMSDTSVSSSLVDGIVLHRGVSGGTVTGTTSDRNARNGFTLTRASDMTIKDSGASDNGVNGLTVDGQPAATGPSIDGSGTASSGDVRIQGGRFQANARYGVEVAGGHDVSLTGARVSGGDMAVVVRAAATHVVLAKNHVADARRQGIAVRDGVTGVQVRDNQVQGTPTGIYLRGSSATVTGNDVTGAVLHGVALVGRTTPTTVSHNTLAGTGSKAIDTSRSTSVLTAPETVNDVNGWSPRRTLRSYVTPLTVLWALLILVLGLSAVQSRRHHRARNIIADPYSHKLLDTEQQAHHAAGAPMVAGAHSTGSGAR